MSDMNKNTAVPGTPAPKPKRPTMQDEADALYGLQMDLASKAKHSDRVSYILFLAFIFVFAIMIFILPDKTFSEQENRQLQTLPKLSSDFDGSFIDRIKEGKFLDRYFSGDFSRDVSDYYADQFPARDFFVGLKGVCEIGMFRGENNGVVLGKDGALLTRMDDPNLENLDKNYNATLYFSDLLKEQGIPVTYAVAGRAIDVLQGKLPALYPVDTVDAPWIHGDALASDNPGENLDYLNLRDVLLSHEEAGEYVMYNTDHHWTTLGAYYAYCVILESWGMEPLPMESFTVETVEGGFYGTAWRTAGLKWVAPDVMELWRYTGDEDLTMTIHDDDSVWAGLYDRSYLEKTDKYGVFLSGNRAYATVEREGGERERLLLVKDSFGHSLTPFLACHFDLEIIDPRYYKQSVAQLAVETGCDRVLVINNLESLTSAAVLSILRMS